MEINNSLPKLDNLKKQIIEMFENDPIEIQRLLLNDTVSKLEETRRDINQVNIDIQDDEKLVILLLIY